MAVENIFMISLNEGMLSNLINSQARIRQSHWGRSKAQIRLRMRTVWYGPLTGLDVLLYDKGRFPMLQSK